MFPLDNLTRVFTASFSKYISALGGIGGPGKDRNVLVSSVRAYVVVVGVVSAVAVDTAVAALWGSSSASGFERVKDTFVGTPLEYRYLYPCEHFHHRSPVGPKLLLQLPIGNDVHLLSLALETLVLMYHVPSSLPLLELAKSLLYQMPW